MAAWQVLFCLTVVSFLCRAFIPMGYMPDLSGQSNARFAITLCSMGHTKTVQLDLAGELGEHAGDDAYGGDSCPFGLSVSQELLPAQDAPALAGVVSFHSLASFERYQVLPVMPAVGPPLGSRAPPVFFISPRA